MGLFGFNFGGKEKIPEDAKLGTSENPQTGKFSKPGKEGYVKTDDIPDTEGLDPEKALLAKEEREAEEGLSEFDGGEPAGNPNPEEDDDEPQSREGDEKAKKESPTPTPAQQSVQKESYGANRLEGKDYARQGGDKQRNAKIQSKDKKKWDRDA